MGYDSWKLDHPEVQDVEQSIQQDRDFLMYQIAYHRSMMMSMDSPVPEEAQDQAIQEMVFYWDRFRSRVGESAAYEAFWDWQISLEEWERSDCNPDGGSE